VEYVRHLLQQIGLEGQRVQMINLSSAMGGQFAWSAAELTEEIRRMGPSPLREVNGGHPEGETVGDPPMQSEGGQNE
jgi:F420-non-reducing hydrogenase iron-sulfur subunit